MLVARISAKQHITNEKHMTNMFSLPCQNADILGSYWERTLEGDNRTKFLKQTEFRERIVS